MYVDWGDNAKKYQQNVSDSVANRRLQDQIKSYQQQITQMQQQEQANQAAQGPFGNQWSTMPVPMDAKGRPLAPKFTTVGDVETGLLKEPYITKDVLDRRALEAARGEALRTPGEMSKWGQMALTQAQNQAARQQAGQMTQAQNQLAMQGGLRSGARERLAAQGMQNQLQAGQQALGNIQMQDEQNRQKWLQMMPGMELQAAQYGTGIQDTNIGRALSEVGQGRLMQQRQYEEAMKAWGAKETAAATPSGGKK